MLGEEPGNGVNETGKCGKWCSGRNEELIRYKPSDHRWRFRSKENLVSMTYELETERLVFVFQRGERYQPVLPEPVALYIISYNDGTMTCPT